ncbi:histidine kinase [Pseudoalteromonas sp. SSM20]|uniref:sensor histidine kinase n=1 Tax=Pseudoalteromonas sp. SSM20 TaxID=3139394 RepID=UPI003BA94837
MDNFKQSLAVEGKSYWVWGPLAFSSFYFLPLIFSFERFSTFKLIAMLLLYCVFIACYVKAVNAKGEKALVPVLTITIIATFGTYITPGTQALFGFACYFCGFNFRQQKGLQGFIGVLLGIALSAYLFNLIDLYYIVPAVITSVGLYFMGRAERRERQHRLSEEQSQQQIEQLAMVAERERIARDLHDLAGHSLSSIALKAELAEKLISNDQVSLAQNEIKQVATISRELLSDIRQAVTNMKQFHLDEQLNVLKNDLLQNGFQVSVNNHLNSASSSTQNTISMILTEATTNIMRHSKGNKVTINITEKEISISDNGKVNTFVKGNGLNGIKQRIEALGGELFVDHENGFKLAMTFKTELI